MSKKVLLPLHIDPELKAFIDGKAAELNVKPAEYIVSLIVSAARQDLSPAVETQAESKTKLLPAQAIPIKAQTPQPTSACPELQQLLDWLDNQCHHPFAYQVRDLLTVYFRQGVMPRGQLVAAIQAPVRTNTRVNVDEND